MICSHIFVIFKVKLERCFGHAETGSGAKKRTVFRRELFFPFLFVSSERMVYEQKFSFASGFLFTCGIFALIFALFDFLKEFYSKCFSQSSHSPF